MKNEYKILIGAIIVILIVLVGAFALSGSNNAQPSVTPTVLPVTVTPTPVPANGGNTGTGAATPTATPLPSVTPTPTPTPTPEPASGVKQTEFGYYITYPPLDPEKWSTNPPPHFESGNRVYFSPTSQTITVPIEEDLGAQAVLPEAQAVVHRDGNLSGTTNVVISLDGSDNMYFGDDYEGDYWIPAGGINANLTDNDNGTYTLRFDPYVSQQNIYIDIWGIYDDDSVMVAAPDFTGTVTLTIVNADAPFSYGSDNLYTLTVNSPSASPSPSPSPSGKPTVQFASASGTYTTGMDNSTKYDFYIPITRTGGDSSLPLPVSLTGHGNDWSMSYFDFYSGTQFAAGNTTDYVHIYATGGINLAPKTATLTIDTTSGYNIGSPSTFTITIQYPNPPG